MSDSGTPARKGKKGEWLNTFLGIVASLLAILVTLGGFHWFSPDRPPVVVRFFDVKPATIEPGNLVILSWDVKNAERVVIEPSTLVGDVQPQGSRQIPVTSTTTFILTAYAPGVAPAPMSRTVQVTSAKPVNQVQPQALYQKPVTPASQMGQIVTPPPPSHTMPRVVVLSSQLSSNIYASSLADEATQSLRENLRNRGFDVLATSAGAQSIEQYASQYRGLAAVGRVTDVADLVAQLSLQVRQEQRQSLTSSVASSFITKLTKAQPTPTIDLISTCSASVNVIRLPEGQYVARGQSDDIRTSNSVDTQMAGWQSAQNDLTIASARQAIAQALSRLPLRP